MTHRNWFNENMSVVRNKRERLGEYVNYNATLTEQNLSFLMNSSQAKLLHHSGETIAFYKDPKNNDWTFNCIICASW